MLQSKYHRPWQPRAKEGQVFNAFARSDESETSFSDDIRQAEREADEAAEIHTVAADPLLSESDSIGAAAAVTPAPKKIWYERFRDRFVR